MSLQRIRPWLSACVLSLLLGGAGFAQGLRDAQLFAHYDPDRFGGGPRANQGLFIVYDGLFWTVSAPDLATFGVPPGEFSARPVWWGTGDEATTTQSSSFNTSFLTHDWTGGQRIEVGFIHEHAGWMISYLDLTRSTQFLTKQGVQVYFDDQIWGSGGYRHLQGYTAPIDPADPTSGPDPASIRDLGVEFDEVTLRNRIKTWGIDASCLRRTHALPRGGFFEWILGARYMEIDEEFMAEATGGLLADTFVNALGDNHLIGPQVGLRWFRTNDRWTLSVQGAFTGAVDFQTVRVRGIVGSQLSTLPPFPRAPDDFSTDPLVPLAMQPSEFNHILHKEEFAPIVELRVEARFQITRALAVHGGWTGMWIDNLARPSGMVKYELGETTTMGILGNRNRQDLFMNGLVLGVEINR